jgi:guanylate kinase
VGKDSVIRELRRRCTDLHFAITATTRPRRSSEIPGTSYHFVTKAEYDDMLDNDQLLAPAQVHGHWYGAPIKELQKAFSLNQDVLLKIDVQGAIQVRRRLPQAVFIFLAPPTLQDLVTRLTARHTESRDELDRRLRDARFEMEQVGSYDYVVVNHDDDLDSTVQALSCIVSAERLRTHRQPIELSKR